MNVRNRVSSSPKVQGTPHLPSILSITSLEYPSTEIQEKPLYFASLRASSSTLATIIEPSLWPLVQVKGTPKAGKEA